MIISEPVKRTVMRKTALEPVSIDPSAIPTLRSVWGFALSWTAGERRTWATYSANPMIADTIGSRLRIRNFATGLGVGLKAA
jgi:hypothetical protein